jgi:hypothetical protein
MVRKRTSWNQSLVQHSELLNSYCEPENTRKLFTNAHNSVLLVMNGLARGSRRRWPNNAVPAKTPAMDFFNLHVSFLAQT